MSENNTPANIVSSDIVGSLDDLREISEVDTSVEYPELTKKESELEEEEESEEEEEETEEEDDEDDDEDEEDEEDDDEDDAEIDELKDGELASKKKFLVGEIDERRQKMSLDAIVKLTVDGEIEELPLREVMSRASANTYGQQEIANIGRQKAEFKREREAFNEEKSTYEENIEMLNHIAQNGDPDDFFEFYALLANKDPIQVKQTMIEKALAVYQRLSSLSPLEKQQYNELRQLKFREALTQRENNKAQERARSEQESLAVYQALKSEGLDIDDWKNAAHTLQEMLDNGQLGKRPTSLEVVDFAVHLAHQNKVISVAKTLGKANQQSFLEEASLIIAEFERREKRKTTIDEALRIVKKAQGLKVGSLSKSLSKKVDRQNKNGKKVKPKPTTARSSKRKQQEGDDEGPLTLEDHYDRLSRM